MELSVRLQAVASLVTVGHKVADIGTDHAYIPIYLVQKRCSPQVIAMDIGKGPLHKAAEHVKAAGLEEEIGLRASDGFERLQPGEVDTAIISGMGGGLVIKILQEHWDVTCSLKECILQPQSELAKVRAFLVREGFTFLAEEMVLDGGKYYPMMKVAPPSEKSCVPEENWDSTQLKYGKLLLRMQHPVLKQFLEREYVLLSKIQEGLTQQSGERVLARKLELKEELEEVRKGLGYYAV